MRRFLRRLFNVLRREAAEADLGREIASHLALLEDEYRRRGMTPEAAELAARRTLGSVALAKDLHRDARSFAWLDDLLRDVRHGARMLVRDRGFAAVAVLTLALGIGATTAIFSVVNGILLRPLPYREPDGLVEVMAPSPRVQGLDPVLARRLRSVFTQSFSELRAQSRTLSHVAAHLQTTLALTGQGDAVRLAGSLVSPALFPMLGVAPQIGRVFEAPDEKAGADAVVLLSHSLWQHRFNSDANVVGRSIALDGRARTVVGVMPEGFQFPDAQATFWIPYVIPPADSRNFINVSVTARLAAGVSIEAAEQEVNAVMQPPAGRFDLVRIHDDMVAPVRSAVLMLAVAVGLVLLIACVNVAHLLLARMTARTHEIAIRRAVGAAPGRLVRQLLTESLLLASLGGIAGTLLAQGGIQLLRTLATGLNRRDLGTGVSLPRLDEIVIDGSVLAFSVGVTVVTALLFGLLPALRHARARDAGLRSERAGTLRVRAALVVAEVALAMVLLVGGTLLIRSFVRLTTVESGYDPTNVLTFQASPGRSSGLNSQTLANQLLTRLEPLPGVQAVGYANSLPLVTSGFRRDLSPRPREPYQGPLPGLHAVSPDFVRAMGMRIIEGRGFSQGGAARREALVSRAFTRLGFFDGPPLGQSIYAGDQTWEVVGILEDFRQFGLAQQPEPEMYIVEFVPPPPGQGGSYFALRTESDPAALTMTIRAIVRQLDSAATVDNVATMEQIMSNAVSRPRLYAVLVGIFASVAVALAAIGIYGVLAFLVAQRGREIGIRMALGARQRQVVGLVIGQSAGPTAVGIAVGIAGAAVLSRYLDGLLFGVTPLDPTAFASAAVGFAAVAMAAAYRPARRATQVDPLIALRSE